MSKGYNAFDWDRLQQQQWLANAQEGYIALDGNADDGFLSVAEQLMRLWLDRPALAPDNLHLAIITCGSGVANSWHIAQQLSQLDLLTTVEEEAGSAGLFLFMAGTRRLAYSGAHFLFHGNPYRWMLSGATDEARAAWFAERTNMSHEWWLEKAKINGTFSFGVDEALEWGVATGRVE